MYLPLFRRRIRRPAPRTHTSTTTQANTPLPTPKIVHSHSLGPALQLVSQRTNLFLLLFPHPEHSLSLVLDAALLVDLLLANEREHGVAPGSRGRFVLVRRPCRAADRTEDFAVAGEDGDAAAERTEAA
jgi:hypothetical protein